MLASISKLEPAMGRKYPPAESVTPCPAVRSWLSSSSKYTVASSSPPKSASSWARNPPRGPRSAGAGPAARAEMENSASNAAQVSLYMSAPCAFRGYCPRGFCHQPAEPDTRGSHACQCAELRDRGHQVIEAAGRRGLVHHPALRVDTVPPQAGQRRI